MFHLANYFILIFFDLACLICSQTKLMLFLLTILLFYFTFINLVFELTNN